MVGQLRAQPLAQRVFPVLYSIAVRALVVATAERRHIRDRSVPFIVACQPKTLSPPMILGALRGAAARLVSSRRAVGFLGV